MDFLFNTQLSVHQHIPDAFRILPKALGLTVSRLVVVIVGSIRDVMMRQQILRAKQAFGLRMVAKTREVWDERACASQHI